MKKKKTRDYSGYMKLTNRPRITKQRIFRLYETYPIGKSEQNKDYSIHRKLTNLQKVEKVIIQDA